MTTAVTTPTGADEARPPKRGPSSSFRADLEGVRAIAVGLVVLYHADFAGFNGGFIGVDVFFVLSGYFITNLLAREMQLRGSLSLPGFYARRARRLLPASAIVIVVTLIASRWAYPSVTAPTVAGDSLAATLFYANIHFAAAATDYLAIDNLASPFLHYWSLSLEEQFYFVWPALLALVGVGAVRARRTGGHFNPRRTFTVVTVVTVASFALCVWLTAANQPWAFFSLPSRAWELGAGAIVALIPYCGWKALPQAARSALGWGGLVAVVLAGLRFNDTLVFPGWIAAIPVLGTVALILAVDAGPQRLLSLRPMRAIGRWSYSLYLWHWPLLVIPTVALGRTPSVPARLGLIAAAVALSALSYRFVEHPARTWKVLTRSNRLSLVLAGVLTGACVAVSLVAIAVPPAVGRTNVIADPPPRPGPAAVAAGAAVTVVPDNLDPALPNAKASHRPSPTCHLGFPATTYPENGCVFGDPNGDKTIVLVGDSHAAMWLPSLNKVGEENGWRIVALTKSACSATTATLPYPNDPNRTYDECQQAHESVLQRIGREKPDLTVIANQVSTRLAGTPDEEPWFDGVSDFIRKTEAAGSQQVLLLGPAPRPTDNVPVCLSTNLLQVQDCTRARDEAVPPRGEDLAEQAARSAEAGFAPTSDWLCTDDVCPVIIGNLLLFADGSHVTREAARWLSPLMKQALVPYLNTPPTAGTS